MNSSRSDFQHWYWCSGGKSGMEEMDARGSNVTSPQSGERAPGRWSKSRLGKDNHRWRYSLLGTGSWLSRVWKNSISLAANEEKPRLGKIHWQMKVWFLTYWLSVFCYASEIRKDAPPWHTVIEECLWGVIAWRREGMFIVFSMIIYVPASRR